MEDLLKKLDKVPAQIQRWTTYALIVPPMALLVGSTLLLSDMVSFGILFWAGIATLAMTAFIWWFWVLYCIFQITKFVILTKNDLQVAIVDLLELRNHLKEYRRKEEND